MVVCVMLLFGLGSCCVVDILVCSFVMSVCV